jgi:hypothetical protein
MHCIVLSVKCKINSNEPDMLNSNVSQRSSSILQPYLLFPKLVFCDKKGESTANNAVGHCVGQNILLMSTGALPTIPALETISDTVA